MKYSVFISSLKKKTKTNEGTSVSASPGNQTAVTVIWNQPEVDLLELEENKEQNFNLPVNQTG